MDRRGGADVVRELFARVGATRLANVRPERLAELADLARAALPTDAEPTAKPTVPTLKTATQLAAVEFAPRFDVVRDLLPAGLNLIAARPKAGKSMMTLQIGLAATAKSPTTFLRRHVAPGAVLYLPYEDGERRLQARIRYLERACGYALDRDRFLYPEKAWPAADAGGLDMLVEQLTARPDIVLVVVDTLAYFRSRPRKGESAYDADYRALGMIAAAVRPFAGAAVVVVTHARKGATSGMGIEAVTGTLGVAGGVDNVLTLTPASAGLPPAPRRRERGNWK